MTALSPCAEFLSRLAGVWRNTGDSNGQGFPTALAGAGAPPFSFREEWTFHAPQHVVAAPLLISTAASWNPTVAAQPTMHTDAGVIKCVGADKAVWSIGHGFGAAEVVQGVAAPDGKAMTFTGSRADITGSKLVHGTKRTLHWSGASAGQAAELKYQFFMQAKAEGSSGTPEMRLHLSNSMTRQSVAA